MFGILGDLTKAVVGVVVETPIAIAADALTLGGSITDKDEPYTATALKGVMKNIEHATKPDWWVITYQVRGARSASQRNEVERTWQEG